MSMKILHWFLISTCVIFVHSELERTSDYLNIAYQKRLVNEISRLFDGINTSFSSSNENYNNEMAMVMEEIVNKLAFYELISDDMDYLVEIDVGNLTTILMEVKQLLDQINMEYDRFKETIHNLKRVNGTILENKSQKFSDKIKLGEQIRSILTLKDKDGYLIFENEMIYGMKNNICYHQLPPVHYIMFQLYLVLFLSSLKEFAVDMLDHQFRYINDKSITLRKLDNILAEGREKMIQILEKDRSFFTKSIFFSNGIENCPPSNLIRDVNFIELERVFQLIVFPERRIVKDASCWGSCEGRIDHQYEDKIYVNGHCTSCEGSITDCRTEQKVTICMSSNSSSSRRYQWIKYREVSDTHCPNSTIIRFPVHDTFILGPLCESCVCTCEENKPFSTKSTFILSSQLVTSDVTNNMVVTGLRFVKAERAIYVQIRQGQLMVGGMINQSSAHWKPIVHLDKNKEPTEGSYIIISKDIRRVNLNDLNCPSDKYVLTGVGLGMSKIKSNLNRITLFINCHLVDFWLGKILPNKTGAMENKLLHETEVMTVHLPPNREDEVYDRDLSRGYYIKFSMSDRIIDGGQSVIPWFDAQNVTSKSREVPLTGAGLHYKSGKYSGGFLNLKLFSMKYYSFLD